MGATFWLSILIVAVFLWWASFYATKRMRIEKNREREEQAKRNLAAAANAVSESMETHETSGEKD